MKNFNSSETAANKSKAKPFLHSLFSIMIIVTITQLFVFFAVMIFGGEFSYIRHYAYETFTEKNSNRKNYIENMLTNKMSAVYETSTTLTRNTEEILEKHNKSIDDITRDKELNKEIVSSSVDTVIALLRQDQVNDAFLILDTGELYSSGDKTKKPGIYIRDMDIGEIDISDNEDLLMEMGSSETASEHGIVLDYEWAALLDMSGNNDLSFFYDTLDAARRSGKKDLFEVSGWYSLSGISRSAPGSIKFTVPLITSDGTVFGIVGIGITEKMIADMFPVYDNIDNDICYVLACDTDNDGVFDPQIHMGPMYSRLVTEHTSLDRTHRIEGEIYDFNYNAGNIKSLGNIQEITLYNPASVFKNQKWAVIAVGQKSGVMAMYTGLQNMLLVSSVIAVAISILGAMLIGRKTMRPVYYMIDKLEEGSADRDGIIKFASTKIYEIDHLGDKIVKLQMDVRDNASRVSSIIGMADMGLGVFMYGYGEKNVFISEGLIKLLDVGGFDGSRDEMVTVEKFESAIKRVDPEDKILSHPLFKGSAEHDGEDFLTEKSDIEIFCKELGKRKDVWLKFSLTRDKSNLLGLVTDITETVLEKKRIEFERDYDVTTGLLNRRAYLAKLASLFEEPEKLKIAADIMIDLDNLKYVNDTYGHDAGDEYIRTAAGMYRSFGEYGGIAARMSGDEFNIFLYGFESKDEIRRIISEVRLNNSAVRCVLPNGQTLRVRASSGLAWFPDDSENIDMLIKYADFSMYTIKHTTKGNLAEFDKDVYSRDSILMTGIEEVNRIIETESVKFAFQPIVNAHTGKLYGYEILMRPQSELITTPLDFIRLVKTYSKMYEMERLTWVKGLEAFDSKVKEGIIPKDCHVFINSLSNCIINPADFELIESLHGDILKNMVLEVLEGENENEDYTEKKQEFVRKWNAQLALDDYGSGYNSELLFLKLSPNVIKIDRSIISGCDTSQQKRDIISELIRMAKSKETLVLAEGAETSAEIETAINCGVDLIQGYYIGYPSLVPAPIRNETELEILDINERLEVRDKR